MGGRRAEAGAAVSRMHMRRERARGLSRAKKSAFRDENGGRIFCEQCGCEPVVDHDDPLADAYIEVHHRETAVCCDEGRPCDDARGPPVPVRQLSSACACEIAPSREGGAGICRSSCLDECRIERVTRSDPQRAMRWRGTYASDS